MLFKYAEQVKIGKAMSVSNRLPRFMGSLGSQTRPLNPTPGLSAGSTYFIVLCLLTVPCLCFVCVQACTHILHVSCCPLAAPPHLHLVQKHLLQEALLGTLRFGQGWSCIPTALHAPALLWSIRQFS